MTKIDDTVAKLGFLYIQEMQKDRDGFISTMKKFPSIASVGKFFYDMVVGKDIIPAIEKIPVSQKEEYWRQVRGEELTQEQKMNFCKSLYAITAMTPLLLEEKP